MPSRINLTCTCMMTSRSLQAGSDTQLGKWSTRPQKYDVRMPAVHTLSTALRVCSLGNLQKCDIYYAIVFLPYDQCCDAANLPEPVGALLGGLEKGTPKFDKAAKEAARTIPGREHGGNCDIKNLTKGCKVSFYCS